MRPPRVFQRSLSSPWRRARQLWLRLAGRFVHRHRVTRVRIGARSFKRIRFVDAWTSDRVASALEHFDGAGVVPRLFARFDEELLVEYVDGSRLARIDREAAQALADFFACVHDGGTRRVPTTGTRILEDLSRDLDFLRGAGVIDATRAAELAAAGADRAPAEVLLGWDYTDAVAKNFVWRDDGSLVGIDVEALRPDGLVGIGIAKSLARGDAAYRAAFPEAFSKVSRLDLAPQLPLAELCCRVRNLQVRLLKGSRLDPTSLDRFRPGSD